MKKNHVWGLGLLALVFAPCLVGGFVYDDAARLWASTPSPLQSDRPLTDLTFLFNEFIFGKDAVWSYHLVSLGLHAANIVLLASLMIALGAGGWSLVAVALFAVHPLQTQAVCYAVQRSELLAAFFSLSALLLYLRSPQRRALVFLCMASAVLSKSWAVVLPILLPVLKGAGPRDEIRKNPFWIAIFLIPVAIVAFLGADTLSSQGAGFAATVGARFEYLLKEQGVMLLYAVKVIAPFGLHFDYSEPAWIAEKSAVLWILLAANLGLLLYCVRRRVDWMLCVFLALAPTSTLVPLFDLQMDHRLYFPMAFLSIGAMRFLKKRPVKVAQAFAMLALVWCGESGYYATLWGNPEALMRKALELEPDYDRPYATLSAQYLLDRNPKAALPLARRAVELKKLWRNHLYYGSALARTEAPELSAEQYRLALAQKPDIAPMVADDLSRVIAFTRAQGKTSEAEWWKAKCFELTRNVQLCR